MMTLLFAGLRRASGCFRGNLALAIDGLGQAARWRRWRLPFERAVGGLLLLAASVGALPMHAATQEAGPRLVQEERHTLVSRGNGKSYVLQVSLPKNYDPNAAVPYPTLYLLDGHLTFPLVAVTRALLELPGNVERVVVVAVSDVVDTHEFSWNVSRWMDYSPSLDAARDARNTQRYGLPPEMPLRSGGGPAFLEALRTEIIPFVEARYRVGPDRGIAGHSMGGVFVTYCLASAPDLFRRYGILSPTTWKDGELLRLIAEKPPALQPRTRVLLTWASDESQNAVKAAQELAALLQGQLGEPGQLVTHAFAGEGHHSVLPASLSRVLTVLYPPATPASR